MTGFTSILPDPHANDRDHDRFHHLDLDRGAVPADLAWAEAHLLEARLADLLFSRQRPRVLALINGDPITDRQWIEQRLRRLRALPRRKAA